MATKTIVVSANPAKDITVGPTRLFIPNNAGTTDLQWIGTGATDITGIYFAAGAPISNLQKQANGTWTARWDPSTTSTWKYDLDLSVDSMPLKRLDPEIENGPPGTVEDGED